MPIKVAWRSSWQRSRRAASRPLPPRKGRASSTWSRGSSSYSFPLTRDPRATPPPSGQLRGYASHISLLKSMQGRSLQQTRPPSRPRPCCKRSILAFLRNVTCNKLFRSSAMCHQRLASILISSRSPWDSCALGTSTTLTREIENRFTTSLCSFLSAQSYTELE